MPSPWESTAALVDARFCKGHTTTLTVTRSKSSRGYGFAVTDAAGGAVVMQVETSYFGGDRDLRSFLFLDAASGRPLLFVEECPSSVWCVGRRWEAFRGRSARQTDRLFLAVDRAGIFEMTTNVDLFLGNNSSVEGAADLAVESSHYGNAMTVSRRGAAVAQIDKKRSGFWGALGGERTYSLRVSSGVDQAFVVALTVIFDQMHNPDHGPRCSCGRTR